MKNFKSFKQVAIQTVSERRARNIDNICRYGINILDQYLGGIIENELVVIGAGAGIGKTELSGHIAIHNAMRGKKVALLSLEGDVGEIVYRYMQRELNKGKKTDFIKGPEYRLNLKDVIAEEDIILKDIPEELDKNLMIFDKSFIPDRKKLLELMRDLHGEVDLFIIDHLHYLDYGSDERAGITEIVKGIKEMTEIMKVPVVLVSHLRRDHDKNGRLPTKSDLHGSSNIEKNANTVILLTPENDTDYIENSNLNDSAYLRGTKIIVDKNRTGMPVPAIFNTTFDLRTKEYLSGSKYEYLNPDEQNKITIHDKIF